MTGTDWPGLIEQVLAVLGVLAGLIEQVLAVLGVLASLLTGLLEVLRRSAVKQRDAVLEGQRNANDELARELAYEDAQRARVVLERHVAAAAAKRGVIGPIKRAQERLG